MPHRTTPEALIVDALTKVHPGWSPAPQRVTLSGLRGETVSFQVAWRPAATRLARPTEKLSLTVEASGPARLYAVDPVPVQVPAWEEHGDGYLTDVPGLRPDVLRSLAADEAGTVKLETTHTGWHAVWVDIELPAEQVTVRLHFDGELILDETLPVSVVGVDLPAHGIEFTQWFHADCLATHYDVETWSDEHWRVIEGQFRAAREMGVTMLLMPLWTPPLDTAEGTYRRTTQLLDITREGGDWHFGTAKLDRWLDLMAASGLNQVEVPHLFTQWGARATPRFEVVVDGEPRMLFGWDTPATDPEYQGFLGQLIPFLKDYFDERIGLANTVFHISDEPNEEHLETYRAARDSVHGLLDGCRVLDALSHPEYAELVDTPVVA